MKIELEFNRLLTNEESDTVHGIMKALFPGVFTRSWAHNAHLEFSPPASPPPQSKQAEGPK